MRIRSFLVAIMALMAGVCSICAIAAPVTYTRTVQPLGNGYGIASIIDTENSTDPAYVNRYVGGSGICSAFTSGSCNRVNGAMLDFGNVPGQTSAANDIVGFYFAYDPSAHDTLNVWHNLVANTNPLGTSNIRSFGFGGVSQSGLFSFRMDGYSGGIAGNGIGTIPVDQSTTTTFTTSYSGTGYTLLGGGTSITSTWTVGPIGETTGMVVSSSFDKYLGRFRSSYLSGGGNLSPHGQYITATNTDGRGSPAINDTAKVIAACTQANPGETYFKGEFFRLRVITYTGDGATYTQTSQNTYNFKDIGDGKTYAFANFFSRSAYSGPQQISINDHGDIAFPVLINVTGGSTTDDTPYRLATRRGILFMSHNNPGVFKCVVDTALASPVLFCDKRTTPEFAPCIGGVAIDNDCNVYFSAASWMGYWPTSDVVGTNAIYKASADDNEDPSRWSLKPILWRGMVWKEDTGTGLKSQELTILPLGNSGSEWFANSASFSPQSINRTKIPDKDDPRYSVGGLFFGVGIGIDGVDGNTMRGIYLCPTDRVASTTNIQAAKALASGEPVNLYDCVITGDRGTYDSVDPTTGAARTYHRYDIKDDSGTLMISTIRTNDTSSYAPLCFGDRVNVSGFMGTDETTGESVLVSTGLVVSGIQAYGMPNKSVGSGYGLSTVGMRVTTWGKVSNLDTSARTFVIDDGSKNPVVVNYSVPADYIDAPSDGQYVSVDGQVTSASPVTISMLADSSVRSH